MRTILTLTVLATLSLTFAEARLPVFLKQDNPVAPEEKPVDEVVQAARGFFIGFQSGLYKTEEVDSGCLNKEAEAKILELFEAVFGGKFDLGFVMKCVTDIMTITSSLSSCSTKSFTDLVEWCFMDHSVNCAPETIMQNVQKNLLVIMGKFTDISTLVMQGLPKDGEQAYNLGLQAGQDIGYVVRAALGFKTA